MNNKDYKVGDKYTGYSPDGHYDEYTVELTDGGKVYLKARYGRSVPIKSVGKLRKGGVSE